MKKLHLNTDLKTKTDKSNIRKRTIILLMILSVVFTVGLMYATIELPEILNRAIMNSFDFPGVDSSIETDITQDFMDTHNVRIIGYGCMVLVVAMVTTGFIIGKRSLASAGAIILFMPVFGHFAFNMFFLAGLGFLRVVWLPVMDVSFDWMKLGDIVFLPYAVLVYLPALIGIDIRKPLIIGIIGLGALVFSIGTFTWFYAKVLKKKVVDFWLYRFSRHPQYLGWIIWSYGVMIYISRLRGPRMMYSIGVSLPWLISALIIICAAMLEEIKMNKQKEYGSYRDSTPFMLPLPGFINRAMSLPMRLILKKKHPEKGVHVLAVFAVYLAIFILLSAPLVIFGWPDTTWLRFPNGVPPFD